MLKAYDAYCIALKNRNFKSAANTALKNVEMGYSPVEQFTFIVDGHPYTFGYRSVYDETIPGYEAAPFYRPGRGFTFGRSYTKKPIIIR